MAIEPNDDTLRDALDAAFEQHATDEPAAAPPAPAAAEAAAPVAPAAPAAPADGAGSDHARDEKGRFAPKEGTAAPAASAAAAAAAPALSSAAPAPGELKAPASWRPEVREKWAAVDPVVRQEVHRREAELQHVLHESSQARNFIGAFERIVAPYEMFIRQEQSNPLQAVQNLMQTAADLRVGSPQIKAQIAQDIITRYGVDLKLLDEMLVNARDRAGGGAAPGQQPQQPLHDPRFDQFLAQQQQMLQQRERAQEQQMHQQLRTFGEAHEFYRDVAGTMADLVEMRARQGQPIDLEKIYAQACQMDEGVSTILTQRGASARANGTSQAVLRAKRAAVSVKSDPTPGDGATVPKDDSIRAAIEAAMESTGRA